MAMLKHTIRRPSHTIRRPLHAICRPLALLLLSVAALFSPLTLQAENRLLGDINLDGQVTIADVAHLTAVLTAKMPPPTETRIADFDNDGHLTLADLQALVALILSGAQPEKVWIPEGLGTGGTGTFD